MCAFCGGTGKIWGTVKYLVWTARDDSTSATQGPLGVASMSGGDIPCPACVPSAYGPIVSVEVVRTR